MIKVRILNSDIDWKRHEWAMVSPIVKDILHKLLENDEKKRLNGPQALSHDFFKDCQSCFVDTKIARQMNINALKNIKLFNKRLQT